MTQSRQDDSDRFSALRQAAEERVTREVRKVANLTPDEIQRLGYELSVYHIELEVQNEELRESKNEVEVSRRKYIDLYEFSPVGLLTLDDAGYISEPNLMLAKMLGISQQHLIHQEFTAFIDPASQDSFHYFFQRLRGARQYPVQCEIRLRPLKQEPITVRIDGIMLEPMGNRTTYRLALSDVTAQKQLETQTLELTAERQRINVLSDFVRSLSHHIRTPLTAIVTGLYLLRKQVDQNGHLEKIDDINKRVFDLNAVLDQLQHMAVLDNLVRIERQPHNLNSLIEDVIAALNHRALDKKVTLLTQLQVDLPLIPLDTSHLDRVLRNLLDNALRFTDKGCTILVTTYLRDNHVYLEVSDNGAGISAETLPHIFKRFYKGPDSVPQNTLGAGLGLSMVQRIIELHHGFIEVSSMPGVSTIFTIRLPLM